MHFRVDVRTSRTAGPLLGLAGDLHSVPIKLLLMVEADRSGNVAGDAPSFGWCDGRVTEPRRAR